ncbi:hypothetical protein CLBKND_01542 [Methylorubrum aminovorans]
MGVYLVTYDLNREVHRPNIVGKIREFSGWAKLSESSCAINTSLTVEQVYHILYPFIDSNDNLYIITLRRPYVGFGKKDVNDWLEQNLSY